MTGPGAGSGVGSPWEGGMFFKPRVVKIRYLRLAVKWQAESHCPEMGRHRIIVGYI